MKLLEERPRYNPLAPWWRETRSALQCIRLVRNYRDIGHTATWGGRATWARTKDPAHGDLPVQRDGVRAHRGRAREAALQHRLQLSHHLGLGAAQCAGGELAQALEVALEGAQRQQLLPLACARDA